MLKHDGSDFVVERDMNPFHDGQPEAEVAPIAPWKLMMLCLPILGTIGAVMFFMFT